MLASMADRSLLGAHTRVLTHIPAGHRASAGCRQAADAPAHGHPHRSAWRCRRERRRPYCCGRVGSSLRPPRGPSCSRTRLRCAMQAEALPSRPVVAARARVARASRGAHGGRARWGARWGPGKAVHGCKTRSFGTTTTGAGGILATGRRLAGWNRVETAASTSRSDYADRGYTYSG